MGWRRMEIEKGFEGFQMGVVVMSRVLSRGSPDSRDSPTTHSFSQLSFLPIINLGALPEWRLEQGSSLFWISTCERWAGVASSADL